MKKLSLLAAAAVGYVLGARAGRQRYEQIADAARKVADNPKVQRVAHRRRRPPPSRPPPRPSWPRTR